MEVYFVRHGETSGNVAKRHQSSHTTLTKSGRRQAGEVALHIKKLSPTHIVSSTQLRAVETAKIINEELGLDHRVEPLFAELNRPKNMYGWHQSDPRSLWYLVRWYAGFAGSSGDQEAGEDYKSLRRRVRNARDFLTTYPPDAKIVVVSHSVFITMFRNHVCRERSMNLLQAVRFLFQVRRTHNTSITKYKYDTSSPGACKWSLVTPPALAKEL